MTKEQEGMTEWLKLERLKGNNLPLPQYETEFSAGVDFAACLTRPCKHIPPGKTHKQAKEFICCEPTLTSSYYGDGKVDIYAFPDPPEEHAIPIRNIKRHRVNGEAWQEIRQIDKPVLVIMPGETIMIPLGFKAEFGKNCVLNLHVRSSIGLSGLILANGTGIVDPDYRGELFAAVYNRNKEVPIIIEHGKRIIQGVMLNHNQAVITETKVNETKRGEGGFGSTGDGVETIVDALEIKQVSETAPCPPSG